MTTTVAQTAPTAPGGREPISTSGGAPPGVPPEGPPFKSALEAEQARTAIAEGQQQNYPQRPSPNQREGAGTTDTAHRAHNRDQLARRAGHADTSTVSPASENSAVCTVEEGTPDTLAVATPGGTNAGNPSAQAVPQTVVLQAASQELAARGAIVQGPPARGRIQGGDAASGSISERLDAGPHAPLAAAGTSQPALATAGAADVQSAARSAAVDAASAARSTATDDTKPAADGAAAAANDGDPAAKSGPTAADSGIAANVSGPAAGGGTASGSSTAVGGSPSADVSGPVAGGNPAAGGASISAALSAGIGDLVGSHEGTPTTNGGDPAASSPRGRAQLDSVRAAPSARGGTSARFLGAPAAGANLATHTTGASVGSGAGSAGDDGRGASAGAHQPGGGGLSSPGGAGAHDKLWIPDSTQTSTGAEAEGVSGLAEGSVSAQDSVVSSGTPQAPPAGLGAAAGAVGLSQAIESLHVTIQLAARQGLAQARIALQPEELGEIRIHLTQTAQGLLVRVSAESPAAAQALAAARTELHQSLSSLGLHLMRLDVTRHDHSPAQSDGSAHEGDNRDGGALGEASAGADRSARPTAIAEPDQLPADPAAETHAPATVALSRGALVDILA
jgi:type III secretion system needle length determinant